MGPTSPQLNHLHAHRNIYTEQSLNECIPQTSGCQQYSSGGKSQLVCCRTHTVHPYITHPDPEQHDADLVYKHHHHAEHHLTACGV